MYMTPTVSYFSLSYSSHLQFSFHNCDIFLLPASLLHAIQQKPESNEQRQNGLKMVEQAIWSKKMSNGVRRTPVSSEQVCIKKQKKQLKY